MNLPFVEINKFILIAVSQELPGMSLHYVCLFHLSSDFLEDAVSKLSLIFFIYENR